MSVIQISELSPVGVELFQDSESFLHELTDQDSEMVQGGLRGSVITSVINVISQASISVGVSINTITLVTMG